MKEQLQNNIEKYMKLRGLTVATFATLANVDRQSVYQWLKGQKMPIDKLFEIAEILGVSAQTLLFGISPIDPLLLTQAITITEKSLGNREVEAEKKSDLISYIYIELSEGNDLDDIKLRRLVNLMR